MFVNLASCTQLLLLASFIASSDAFKGRILDLLFGNGECKADAKESWSYRGKNAAQFWGSNYPECNGKAQSPIAITSREAVPDVNLSKLAMNNYDVPVSKATIENNGHTVQVTPTDGVDRTIFVKGSTYKLLHFHFHWGDAYYKGSEHTLNGIQYSLEMHLVHQNANKQLAVVGVFFQEQSSRNAELQNIIKSFKKVLYKGTSTDMNSKLNLDKLLPMNPSSFYRYEGSLTTPGCAEIVTWSVLTKAIPVGHKQMDEFRKLYSATKDDATPKCKLSNNYRPVQPLNNRKVYISQ